MNNSEISEIVDMLRDAAGNENVLENEPMSMHTSFKTGGRADVLVKSQSEEKLKTVLALLSREGIKPHVIGNGSNIIVRDKGIRGVVIKIGRGFDSVRIFHDRVEAEAGILLSRLANMVLENSLSGLEFAAGIPGTLGGAVAMNAGAYGGEMKDIVKTVHTVDMDGNEAIYCLDQMEFGYRTSIVQQKGLIVTRVVMKLQAGDCKQIRAAMDDYSSRRTSKQPLSLPSAGSTFKRPHGHFAGKLIEDAGLKGMSVGGASVSTKHCGFIVSDGTASSNDIIDLIARVKQAVNEKFGVLLEEEVKIIGEE